MRAGWLIAHAKVTLGQLAEPDSDPVVPLHVITWQAEQGKDPWRAGPPPQLACFPSRSPLFRANE